MSDTTGDKVLVILYPGQILDDTIYSRVVNTIKEAEPELDISICKPNELTEEIIKDKILITFYNLSNYLKLNNVLKAYGVVLVYLKTKNNDEKILLNLDDPEITTNLSNIVNCDYDVIVEYVTFKTDIIEL